ncbi:uncharacterized protein LOC143239885 [Tachypleus tridentatus]|uniref:uncharacterized protein LOC143239885 n=1 Tax=Tachypleus tridentatus TaxID=6853 RepID=UPI003FD39E3D
MISAESCTIKQQDSGQCPVVVTGASSSSPSSPYVFDNDENQRHHKICSRHLHSINRSTLGKDDTRASRQSRIQNVSVRYENVPHRHMKHHHDSRRLHRVASAKDSHKTREKLPVRRTFSARGKEAGALHQHHHHQHRRRSSHRNSQRNRRLSEINYENRDRFPSRFVHYVEESSSCSGSPETVTETKYTELDLDGVFSSPPKEIQRRRIVCAVVLTALAILISSVLLVTITLLLTPSRSVMDKDLRKENEDIFRIVPSTMSPYGNIVSTSVNQTSNVTGPPG